MPHNQEIRWLQRFDNYKKALAQLNDAVNLLPIMNPLPKKLWTVLPKFTSNYLPSLNAKWNNWLRKYSMERFKVRLSFKMR